MDKVQIDLFYDLNIQKFYVMANSTNSLNFIITDKLTKLI